MPNPYSATTNLTSRDGIFADSAILVRSSFLYRIIRLLRPELGQDKDSSRQADEGLVDETTASETDLIIYSGWWFWQRVTFNGHRVWSKVSWVALNREIEFRIPAGFSRSSIDQNRERVGKIEIDFGPGLRIRRFRLWMDDVIVLDEIV